MSGHTMILDVRKPRERQILDDILSEMGIADRVDLSVRGDRVTLSFGR